MKPNENRGLMRAIVSELHWGAVRNGLIASVLLCVLIVVGSRNLQHFDAALVGYTFACIFALFAIVYRYSVWLTKPPTRRYWIRGWQLCFSPRLWKNLRSPRILGEAIWSKLIFQGFVLKRSFHRWIGHMLIAWGCVLGFAITFPLVFGWIHFEQGAIEPPTYTVVFFGFRVQELPLSGIFSWFVFHGLVVASLLVIPGVMIAMYRRMMSGGAVAVQRFSRDFLPLIIIFAVSFSGLLIWINYEWLDGYYHVVLAQLHAFTVIALLLYLPFGKLFHIFQRPASIGISYYKAANIDEPPAKCPVTGEGFAFKMQTEDLKEVLHEMEFDYQSKEGKAPEWNEISPRGRRMTIARAHTRTCGSHWNGKEQPLAPEEEDK